ncbi:AAA family ATPase [Frisingicoccus sp.]|uniref:cytidylate kinase-like family protein n=1 Tax=Frisingicoccus sp. TaxID=1918627 RepID=UPI002EAAF547|nr:cytidylate kinase-like family protein [Frisingicoccus sp.]
MRILTISREFGSGGRELGKRMADILGYDYYDNEIISAVAKNSGMSEHYVNDTLSNHGWQNFPITFHSTLGSSAYPQSGKIKLLVEQKKVIENIATLGKDCIIVGRNADAILQTYEPFNIFVCADTQAKLHRCKERAPEGENLSEKELLRKMRQIDKSRIQTRELMTDAIWGDRKNYHLTVNTTGWSIKELALAVAEYTEIWFRRAK